MSGFRLSYSISQYQRELRIMSTKKHKKRYATKSFLWRLFFVFAGAIVFTIALYLSGWSSAYWYLQGFAMNVVHNALFFVPK